MRLKNNIYTLIGTITFIALTIGIYSCQSTEQPLYADKSFYIESKDAFKISILPKQLKEVKYRIYDETVMVMHGLDSTQQEMYIDITLSKDDEMYSFQPTDIQLQILNSDGTRYEFDNNNKDLTPLVKDLETFTDHVLEVYASSDGEVKYFLSKNKVTKEEQKLTLLEDNPKDFFLAATLPFFELLPPHAVKVGQTWKNKGEVKFMGYAFVRNSSFTLVSIDEDGLATILEHSVLSTDPGNTESVQEFNMVVKLKGKSEAYYIVDLNESVLVSGSSNLNMEGQIETASESIPIKIRGKGRVINKN